MSNQGKKKPPRKHVREAAAFKRQEHKWWIILAVCVVAAVAIWAGYTWLLVTGAITAGIEAYATAVIMAFLLGLISNKIAKLRTECRKIMNYYGFTIQDVKDQMKADKR